MTRPVYLPEVDWYLYWNNARIQGGTTVNVDAPLTTLPLYVKAGAILPMSPVLQHTGEFNRDLVTLRIYPGVMDASPGMTMTGVSYRHESGLFMRLDRVWNDRLRTFTLTSDRQVTWPCRPRCRSRLSVWRLPGASPDRQSYKTHRVTDIDDNG